MLKALYLIVILFVGAVNLTELSYYEILGVSKQATTQEIKQAYKKLAIRLHPDKNPDTAEQQRFIKITEAYETLKDPQKRHKYNLYGSQQYYTRKYDYHSQTEYNNLYYNGLYHDNPYVDSLSGSNFYSYLNDGFYFINFYSPFCPPCQNLADHWKKLAEVYKGIVKVGAVNCKHYNSFCYNNMRIGSYPSLLFYPDGRNGNYVYYRGAHRFDSLDEFVLMYIRSKIDVQPVSQVQNTDQPVAYIVDSDVIGNDALARIAYRLKGLAKVVTVKENLRKKLSSDPDTVVVFKYKQTHEEMDTTQEEDIVKTIVDSLPRMEAISLDRIKNIRNDLRNGHNTAWVLYFTRRGDDYLKLHRIKATLPRLHYGEIDCDKLKELCSSLQVEETPALGVLKPGGAYQRVWDWASVVDAVRSVNLHTVSTSDLTNILKGDMSTWVLLVCPHRSSWEHNVRPFTEASLQLSHSGIHFGIMACTESTEQYCNVLTVDQPVIVVQNRTKRHFYNGRTDTDDIVQYIELLKETDDLELTEDEAIEMARRREQSWVIAYMPAKCGRMCDQLLQEWRVVAKRLRPLRSVRGGVQCGVVRCAGAHGALCGNVRAPAARLYPVNVREHYAVSLQQLSQAPYMLEWVFDFLTDTIMKLNWHSFSRTVIAEDLNPRSNKKPWLVYFHSPRCYRCYEMFPEFAILSILLKDSMHYGKVNCVSERGLCQHENIGSYPSLQLYLPRGNTVARVLAVPLREHSSLIQDIRPHLASYDINLLANLDIDVKNHLRDEL